MKWIKWHRKFRKTTFFNVSEDLMSEAQKTLHRNLALNQSHSQIVIYAEKSRYEIPRQVEKFKNFRKLAHGFSVEFFRFWLLQT